MVIKSYDGSFLCVNKSKTSYYLRPIVYDTREPIYFNISIQGLEKLIGKLINITIKDYEKVEVYISPVHCSYLLS